MDRMPNAVLLDWNMPVKNGLEFLQELRALEGQLGNAIPDCALAI